jgi:asparagine synthase (glutamine-hydrolysing)
VSGIAAIVHGDGRPCNEGHLEAMLAAAAHRGPEGRGRWISGPAGIGHLHLDCGLLRPSSAQPLVSPDGHLALSLDGRLDNRAELVAELGRRHPAAEALSDADLVMAAYRSYGEGFAARLLGDFALVLWDGERRQLVAARDALGTRMLFYYWDGSTLIVASECAQLFAHPSARCEPDEKAISNLIRLHFNDVASTFYKKVHRLPPAHVLTLRARTLSLKRYWDAPAGPSSETLADDEYAERFRDLFEESVRCRIGSTRTVGCLFSGGVDSSSVLSMAHTVSAGTGAADLKAFSMVFKQAPVDDTRYIELVRTRYRTAVHLCEVPRVGPLRNLDRIVDWTASPWVDVHHPVVTPLMTEARTQGCRLLLTGLRGDDLFGGLGQLADLTRGLHLRRALAELEAWAPTVGRRRTARLAWQLCLRPLARAPQPPFRSYAAEQAHDAAVGTLTILTTELFEVMAARFGLVPLYPFWDRRLVEFVLMAPADIRSAAGQTKRVLRQALVGVVPEPNLERRDKLNLTPQFRRGLVEYDREQLQERLAALHPMVEREVGRRQVDRMLADLLAGRSAPSLRLWFAICVNVWLQKVEGAVRQREPSPQVLIEGGMP